MSLPPAELEQLVRDELRVLVAELVRRLVPELVAEALNGTAPTPPANGDRTAVGATGAPDATASTARTVNPHQIGGGSSRAKAKVYKLCGETKPAAEFDVGRRQCKACRRDAVKRRARERRAMPADAEEPHPALQQVREGRPGEPRRMTDEIFREHRRQLIEQAPTTTEERDGRVFVVRHIASQYAP